MRPVGGLFGFTLFSFDPLPTSRYTPTMSTKSTTSRLYSGGTFDFSDPWNVTGVKPIDVGMGLGSTPRFNGQRRQCLSVLAHMALTAVLVDHLVVIRTRNSPLPNGARYRRLWSALRALTHDALEMFTGDHATPMKNAGWHLRKVHGTALCPDAMFAELLERAWLGIAQNDALPIADAVYHQMQREVKIADELSLCAEAAWAHGTPFDWKKVEMPGLATEWAETFSSPKNPLEVLQDLIQWFPPKRDEGAQMYVMLVEDLLAQIRACPEFANGGEQPGTLWPIESAPIVRPKARL